MINKYTVEQIKKVFWEEFHESGEQWFPYSDNQKEEVTNSYWESFLEALQHD